MSTHPFGSAGKLSRRKCVPAAQSHVRISRFTGIASVSSATAKLIPTMKMARALLRKAVAVGKGVRVDIPIKLGERGGVPGGGWPGELIHPPAPDKNDS